MKSEVELEDLAALLPRTYCADLDLAERIRLLVGDWRVLMAHQAEGTNESESDRLVGEDDTCPPSCHHCGDGPQSVGTTNHIECVCDVMTKLAQARTYCDNWWYMADMQAGRAEEAEAEVERLKKDLRDMTAMRDGSQRAKDRAEKARDHIARQLEKAERKYDDPCRMVRNYQGETSFEVFEAPDGEPGIRVVNWRERAEKAEAALTHERDCRAAMVAEYGKKGPQT